MSDKAYTAGADEFRSKPFDLAAIKDLIGKLAATERAMPIPSPTATVREAIDHYGRT